MLLTAGALFFVVAHLGGYIYAVHAAGLHNWRLFNLYMEANFPTWYSTVLLLAVAIAAWFTASTDVGRRHRRFWLGIALVFVYLSADEASTFHEGLNRPLRSILPLPHFLEHRTWGALFAVALVVLAIVYLPFLRALPSRTRNVFVAAGGMYVMGALVLEFLAGDIARGAGKPAASYQIIAMTKEGMEMIGVVLFLYGVLDYIADADGSIRIGLLS